MIRCVTKTAAGPYGDDDDQFIWAYDVSFGILILVAISVAESQRTFVHEIIAGRAVDYAGVAG